MFQADRSATADECFHDEIEVEHWFSGRANGTSGGLSVQNGQDKLNGQRTSWKWFGQVRKHASPKMYSLLDATELAITTGLTLQSVDDSPDFLIVDLCRLLGFPNISALIVRRRTVAEMDPLIARKWSTEWRPSSSVPMHSILAVDHALNVYEEVYGHCAMRTVSCNTSRLVERLHISLSGISHSNGKPLCRIYRGKGSFYGDPITQGPIIAFNLQRPNGTAIDAKSVLQRVTNAGILLGIVEHPLMHNHWPIHRANRPLDSSFPDSALFTSLRVCLSAEKAEDDVDYLVNYLITTFIDDDSKSSKDETELCGCLTLLAYRAKVFRDLYWWDDATEVEMKVLNGRRRISGNRHPRTLESLANLARSKGYPS